MDAKDATKIA
jgi:hypothetical protein